MQNFVAFDTSAKHFGFLKETGGFVFEAADEKQLNERLSEIYEKRIFAEWAMPQQSRIDNSRLVQGASWLKITAQTLSAGF